MLLNQQIYRTTHGVYRVRAIAKYGRYTIVCQKRELLFFWFTTRIEDYYDVQKASEAWFWNNDKYHRLEQT